MLPDLQSSLLCDDVRQERNGKFMLIGLFDMIAVPKYPAVFQRVCIVNRWCCGMGTFAQRSRLVKPDGLTSLIDGREVNVKLADSEATATCVELLLNVKFEVPGTYWVEVLLGNDLKMRYPLKALVIRPRTESQAQPGEPGLPA
jgi:hypothetical protein